MKWSNWISKEDRLESSTQDSGGRNETGNQEVLLLPCMNGRFNRKMFRKNLGFPGGSEGKASACNAGDLGSISGLGRFPWRRKWQSTPVFLPGQSHGQRNLVGYSL